MAARSSAMARAWWSSAVLLIRGFGAGDLARGFAGLFARGFAGDLAAGFAGLLAAGFLAARAGDLALGLAGLLAAGFFGGMLDALLRMSSWIYPRRDGLELALACRLLRCVLPIRAAKKQQGLAAREAGATIKHFNLSARQRARRNRRNCQKRGAS